MCYWSFQQPGLLIGSQASFPLAKCFQIAPFAASESTSSEASTKWRAVCGQFPCRCCKRHKDPHHQKNATCVLDCTHSHAMVYVALLCLLHTSFQAPAGKWARNGLKASLGSPWNSRLGYDDLPPQRGSQRCSDKLHQLLLHAGVDTGALGSLCTG